MTKNKKLILTLVGPFLFVLCNLLLPETVFADAKARTAVGTVVWMAFWWITGPVDFAVTAFLPIAVNALFQITDMSAVIANYASETILLLLGASVLSASWEETGLDSRMATKFLSLIGSNLRHQVIFWFILCALLSSILPNAVVCAAVTPIAVSMLRYVGEGDIASSRVGSLLLLTIAYATGVGGLASPLGGAMNLVTVEYLEQLSGQEYMYVSWVVRFLPIMIVLIASNILILLIGCKKGEEFGGSKEYFVAEYKKLPKMSREEILSMSLFLVATILAFTRQFYQHLLPEARLYNFYGSTESGCICIYNFNRPESKKHCIGKPACNAKITIVDDDRNEIASSEQCTGLLASTGGMNMVGYWKDEEETRKVLIDGVVYTNDVAYFDEDGDIILLGRKGDVINVGGNKVSPDEIENVAKTMPGIADCGVIPVADAVKGNVPKLFVQLQRGTDFDPIAIRSFLAKKLEPYKVPEYIVQIDKIPRSFNGKLLRKELK